MPFLDRGDQQTDARIEPPAEADDWLLDALCRRRASRLIRAGHRRYCSLTVARPVLLV